MPKYTNVRGVCNGRRCAYCGRGASGLLFGRFGLCRKCWKDKVEETLTACPWCVRTGTWRAMDEEEKEAGKCRACQGKAAAGLLPMRRV